MTRTAAVWIRTLRVTQWTKNLVIGAAWLFALGDRHTHLPFHAFGEVLAAMVWFCLVSSAVYIVNDIHDIERDRAHPRKRHRPIAAGQIAVPAAWTAGILLFLIGLTGGYLLDREFGHVLLGYVVLQGLYTHFLKQVALVDVFVIAVGFVLRAMGGGYVIDVPISPWLLLCTLLLALFLALCKRRHEKVEEESVADLSRPALRQYSDRLLDQLIGIVCSATITCYAIYTLSPETVAKFETAKLGFTVPFVIFGLFRYLDLVYRHAKGDRPEKILLTDPPTLINLTLYGLTVLGVFFWG